jgi:hypothetical protein
MPRAGCQRSRWRNTEVLDILQIVLKRELKARADSQRRRPDHDHLTPPHSAVSEMTRGGESATSVHRQGVHSGAFPGPCCSFAYEPTEHSPIDFPTLQALLRAFSRQFATHHSRRYAAFTLGAERVELAAVKSSAHAESRRRSRVESNEFFRL